MSMGRLVTIACQEGRNSKFQLRPIWNINYAQISKSTTINSCNSNGVELKGRCTHLQIYKHLITVLDVNLNLIIVITFFLGTCHMVNYDTITGTCEHMILSNSSYWGLNLFVLMNTLITQSY